MITPAFARCSRRSASRSSSTRSGSGAYANQLVAALETHSASEDAGMYPWAAQHVALVSQRMLYAAIGRGLERE